MYFKGYHKAWHVSGQKVDINEKVFLKVTSICHSLDVKRVPELSEEPLSLILINKSQVLRYHLLWENAHHPEVPHLPGDICLPVFQVRTHTLSSLPPAGAEESQHPIDHCFMGIQSELTFRKITLL